MKSKKVWIQWKASNSYGTVYYKTLMTPESDKLLYDLFPDGNVNLVLKDSHGTQRLKLKDLYNKK